LGAGKNNFAGPELNISVMRYLLCLLILLGAGGPALFAQTEGDDILTRSVNVGMLQSNRGPGLTIGYNVGDPAYRQWTFNFDMFVIKDLRETQIEPFIQDQGRKFIYGKLNHFLVASPSVGMEWPLFTSSSLNPFSVRGGLKLGPAIGFLNPYQVEILTPVPGAQFRYTIEIQAYDPAVHAYSDIFGRANFISSRLQPSLTAGLSLKGYAIMDFSRHEDGLGGLVFSTQADLFPKTVPIIAEINGRANRQFFFAVSLGLIFGRGW
jgi:hypothetical protein